MKLKRITILVTALLLFVTFVACQRTESSILDTDTDTDTDIEKNSTPSSSIDDVKLSNTSVVQYELLEITFDVNSTYENPFDPSQVDIIGIFTTPSGSTVQYPAFYTRNIRDISEDFIPDYKALTEYGRVTHYNTNKLIPHESDCWAIRFSWDEVGTYSFVIQMEDDNGIHLYEGNEFTITSGDSTGPVVISPYNPRYLVYRDTGEDFIPLGVNVAMAFSTEVYVNGIKGIADNGGNFARIWSSPDYLVGTMGIESHYMGIGWYNLDRAAGMDRVLHYARSRDVKVEFTFDSFVSLNLHKQWYGQFNDLSMYNTRNGGFLTDAQDFWTDAQTKQAFKNRIRYSVARWGWDITIGMWELINEIDGTDGYRGTKLEKIGSEWITEMAEYLKSIDPYQRIVSLSSATKLSNCPVTFGNSNVELAKPHMYDTPDIARVIASLIADGLTLNPRVLVGEFGITNIEDADPSFESMHIGLWAGIHSGATGAPLLWYWNEVMRSGKLTHLQPLSKYIEAFNFSSEKLVELNIDNSDDLTTMGLVTEDGTRAILWTYNNKYKWQNANPEVVNNGTVTLKEMPEGTYKVELWNTRTGAVTRTDTLIVESNGQLIVLVGTVAQDVAIIINKQ